MLKICKKFVKIAAFLLRISPPHAEFLSVKLQYKKAYVNLSETHFYDEPIIKNICFILVLLYGFYAAWA